MVKPIMVVDEVVALKLISGEEMVVRVTGIGEGVVAVKDSRTLMPSQNGQGVDMIPTYFLGGELQEGQVYLDKIIAISKLNLENENKYLSAVSGLQLPK